MLTISERFMWVKEDFDRIAISGVLGDPLGRLAFAYLRVSSAGQAEEGRSGFPRQLLHVHEKAQALCLAIPWYLLFFDDSSGFEFRDRPALTSLRDLARQQPRPADDLVIENLDRLSREATWHQGFLLDEFEKEHNIRVHFWKELGSKLERVVYGTIAQDRMLTDLERMAAGNILKAKSGRVTARTPAYGYKFVNEHGREENTTKDTHYAFSEPEATVMRKVYHWLLEERITVGEISRRLTATNVTPPKQARSWEQALLRVLIKNPVYKGEFYAHRHIYVKKLSTRTGKEVTHKTERPRNEWIMVPVPPLVSPEIWDEAQRVMTENKTLSLRNSKREYLLVGLTYCADCKNIKMSIGGRYHHKMTGDGLKHYETLYYRCTTRARLKHIMETVGYHCTMPQITSRRLDELVWNAVVNVLFDRQQLEAGIERYFSQQRVETTREEIAFVQSQLTELDVEDQLLYQAYVAKAFDADEYAIRRHALKERKQYLDDSKEQLQRRLSHEVDKEERKQQILASVDELKRRAGRDAPFELKRRILLTVVEKIIVNTRDEWFEMQGAITGKFDFIPADTDSGPQPE